MDKNILKGQWKETKGQVKKFWAKITDDELDEVEGNLDELAGLLQKKYGYSRDKAKDQIRQKLKMFKEKIQ